MTDALQMLEEDHREVERLFERYRAGRGREQLIQQICTELVVHTLLEEQEVYPLLGSEVSGGARLESHAEDEHREVTELLVEIVRRDHGGSDAEELMDQLVEAVGHHVEEEEGEVFPKLREAVGPDRLEELAERLAGLKQRLTGRIDGSGPLAQLPKEQLYALAQEKGVKGRSDMTKEDLLGALGVT